MELKAAVKLFRRELNLTQMELARALHLSYCTINRWENGRGIPSPSAAANMLHYAECTHVTPDCRDCLKKALTRARREEIRISDSSLYSIERESICQLVDEAAGGIYVSDIDSDDLLYMNAKAEEYFGGKFISGAGQKCYQLIQHRNTPCPFCIKRKMNTDCYTDDHVVFPVDGRNYHVHGKKINWNGKAAHVQYVFDETDTLMQQGGFAKLMNLVPAGLCIVNVFADGAIELSYMNDGYFRLLHTTREQRIQYSGFAALDAVYAEDRESVRSEVLKANRNGTAFQVFFRLIQNDGSFRWLHVQGMPAGKTDTRSVYYCAMMDIDPIMKRHEVQELRRAAPISPEK